MKHLLNLERKDIESFLKSIGEKPYRTKQIYRWIYRGFKTEFNHMTDIPAPINKTLYEYFTINSLKLVSTETASDGTVRYNFSTFDGDTISCVRLKSADRTTLCLSTQIGCPIGCIFCSSGKTFKRNLTKGEILDQFLIASNQGGRTEGVLFMGMGEPLLNYNNVVSAAITINSSDGFEIGARHITLSTIGIVNAIKKLADDNLKIRLAVSLHAADDKLRNELVPNAKNSAEAVIQAGLEYSRKTKTRFTVEYILLRDKNCAKDHMNALGALLKKLSHKDDALQINLIPSNSSLEKFSAPDKKAQKKIKEFLISKGFFTIIRHNKGNDIKSACGQLAV